MALNWGYIDLWALMNWTGSSYKRELIMHFFWPRIFRCCDLRHLTRRLQWQQPRWISAPADFIHHWGHWGTKQSQGSWIWVVIISRRISEIGHTKRGAPPTYAIVRCVTTHSFVWHFIFTKGILISLEVECKKKFSFLSAFIWLDINLKYYFDTTQHLTKKYTR